MSCETRSRLYATSAARRNGIGGQVSRYLNTLGSWSTYRGVDSAGEIPERIAQVTGTFFGVKGLVEGHPRLAGVLGAVVGVHALEQVTGGAATTALRLYGRGRPVARYRGIMIRKSPFTPRAAGAINRLSGGRLLAAGGYYFSESGRTWHAQSLTFRVGDTPRTLTRVNSFSIPQREYFFDRPLAVPGEQPESGGQSIPIQRVVDAIKGDEEPDAIPGFIGSVNELEGLTPLRGMKRALFAANWLLVDAEERDGSGSEYVDYGAVTKGPDGGGVYRVTPSSRWPTTGRVPVRTTGSTRVPAYGRDLFRSKQPPAEQYKDRIRIDDREYPLAVKRLVRSPLTGQMKADAVYYDDRLRRWREVVEDEDRLKLARAVQEGRLSVVAEKDWPK